MINFKLWRVNLLNYQPISVRVPMDHELGAGLFSMVDVHLAEPLQAYAVQSMIKLS